MELNIRMIFRTPYNRMMCFDNVNATSHYDLIEIARASVQKKKREFSVDLELEEVYINGELVDIKP